MSEIEQTKRKIARCRAKRDAAKDDASRWYFAQRLIGWRAWLAKLEQGGLKSVRRS